jgi:hypothetical protein
MAHPHQPYWLWTGGVSFALGAALIGVAGAFDTTRASFPFWTSGITISAYVAFSISLSCFVCALRELRFPLAANSEPRETKQEWSMDPRAHSGNLENGTRSTSGERTFTEVTPKELISVFKSHTSAQAQKLLEPYYGQWLPVSGTLGDVGAWTDSHSMVTFHPSFRAPSVIMIFRDKDVFDRRLSTLRPRTRITVVGRIERINGSSLQITDCEIKSVCR